jgi:1-deoxy-D-xylulose-5-phosphate synthase
MAAIPVGKGEIRRQGKKIALLAFGPMLQPALHAAEALDATVANMRFVKPLDIELVVELARSHELLVSIEEGCIMGGAGSAVGEALAAGLTTPLLQLGLPDTYIEHGDPVGLLADCGLNAEGIEASIRHRLSQSLA